MITPARRRVSELSLCPSVVEAVLGPHACSATLAVLAEGGVHASITDPEVVGAGGQWMWVHPNPDDLAALAELVESGAVNVEVAQTFALDQVADAFAQSREGHTRGKLVIEVS